jgi:hypothetical protein
VEEWRLLLEVGEVCRVEGVGRVARVSGCVSRIAWVELRVARDGGMSRESGEC